MGNIEVLGFDVWNILFTIINLLVFYLLLKKFLFGPVMKVMDERQEKIDNEKKETHSAKKEATDMKNRYEVLIGNADDESHRIIEKARDQAKVEYEQIVTAAQSESDRLISYAHKSIEMEKSKALKDVRSDIADLAVDVAKKVIGENVSVDKDNAIYDDFFKQVGDDNDSNN